MLNTLRTMALTPLMTVDARISQIAYLPISELSQSTAFENLSSACNIVSRIRGLATGSRGRKGWIPAAGQGACEGL